MNKIALITGATGGIGGAFAKVLEQKGYELVLPVRNISKITNLTNNFFAKEIDMQNEQSFISFLQEVKNVRSHIDLVVLAAGRFAWDNEFENEESAISELEKANFQTKVVAIQALKNVFGDSLKQTDIVIISSHAVHFDESHPFRKGEEGYVRSMIKASEIAKDLQRQGIFKQVFLEEPGRIGTESAKRSFTVETIGQDPDWQQEISPEDYAKSVLIKTAFL